MDLPHAQIVFLRIAWLRGKEMREVGVSDVVKSQGLFRATNFGPEKV